MFNAFFDVLTLPGIICDSTGVIVSQNKVCQLIYPNSTAIGDIVPGFDLEETSIPLYKTLNDCFGRRVEVIWSYSQWFMITINDPRPVSAGLSTITEASVENSLSPSIAPSPSPLLGTQQLATAAAGEIADVAKTLQSGVSLLRSLTLTEAYVDAVETIESGLAQIYRQANVFSFLSQQHDANEPPTAVNTRKFIAEVNAVKPIPVRITHQVPVVAKLSSVSKIARALREAFLLFSSGVLIDTTDGGIVVKPQFPQDAPVAASLSATLLQVGAEHGLWTWSGRALTIAADPLEDSSQSFDLMKDLYENRRILVVGADSDERLEILRQLAPWRFDVRLAASHQELELLPLGSFELAILTDSADDASADIIATQNIPTVYGGVRQELLASITTCLLSRNTDHPVATRKLRILLLTDDKALQQMAKTIVEKDGHSLTIGRGSVLSQTSIDLTILDWSFVSLVKRLASMYPSALCLLLVARDEKQQTVATRLRDSRTIAGTVVKPLTEGALLLAIRQIAG
jgi:CheY-like chemotaxis protein